MDAYESKRCGVCGGTMVIVERRWVCVDGQHVEDATALDAALASGVSVDRLITEDRINWTTGDLRSARRRKDADGQTEMFG